MPRGIALKGNIGDFTPTQQRRMEKQVAMMDVVQELLAQGWELTPNRRRRLGFPWERPRPGDPVVAEYRRKCGAVRRIAIPHPPERHLRVPVYDKIDLSHEYDASDAMMRLAEMRASVLTFRFKGYEKQADQFGDGPYIAVYEEE